MAGTASAQSIRRDQYRDVPIDGVAIEHHRTHEISAGIERVRFPRWLSFLQKQEREPNANPINKVVLARMGAACGTPWVSVDRSRAAGGNARFVSNDRADLNHRLQHADGLNLSGGLTVTFSGGQFIHYKDANFDGTMYATSSAAGCQRLPFP